MGGLLGERRNWAAGFYFGLLFCAVALLVGPFGVELARASPSSSSPSSTAAAAADDDDDDVGDIALGDGESGACCGEGGGVGEDKRQWNGKHTLRRRSKLGLAVLGAIGAGLLLLGVSGGGTRAQWADWSVVLPFCLGGVLVGMVGLAGAYCVVVLVCVRRLSVRTVMLYIGGLLHGVMVCSLSSSLSDFSSSPSSPLYLFQKKKVLNILLTEPALNPHPSPLPLPEPHPHPNPHANGPQPRSTHHLPNTPILRRRKRETHALRPMGRPTRLGAQRAPDGVLRTARRGDTHSGVGVCVVGGRTEPCCSCEGDAFAFTIVFVFLLFFFFFFFFFSIAFYC